ncbi:MAG: ECF transporter S component [Oscillospiraceae bacterium]|nr:ECF transporter S component [Oscillospiraceae bacterium]
MQSELNESNRISKRLVLTAAIILIAVPLTIAFGIFFLDDKKYYIISLLIIIYTMIPFFISFEKRRPQARELLVIAILCAITVAGRAAFVMLPQVKPVAAIVIISGVCFGPTSGFLVGAVSAFVSNIFFGQGPSTPWQMFCFGLIGFLAGILFRKGIIQKSRFSLCIFGGISVIVIYGGIINLSALLMFSAKFSWKALMTIYAAGIPFDLVHAASTMFFLVVLSNPMIVILDRIKKKYGLIET